MRAGWHQIGEQPLVKSVDFSHHYVSKTWGKSFRHTDVRTPFPEILIPDSIIMRQVFSIVNFWKQNNLMSRQDWGKAENGQGHPWVISVFKNMVTEKHLP
jgi:hypothetical protein